MAEVCNHAGKQREKVSDINLTNDEEEGFSAMMTVRGERGSFRFDSCTCPFT